MLVYFLIIILLTGSVQLNSHNKNILVDLKDFKYLIESSVCSFANQNELLGLILVTSAVGHVDLRASHRRSISQSELNEMGLARVFLLGEIPQNGQHITQEDVTLEQDQYKDLMQGNFQDTYRNISYKNLMGLKWASEKCWKAKFLIRLDDDTVYDVFFYRDYINKQDMNSGLDRNDFLAGHYPPVFNIQRIGKWAVNETEWPSEYYPPHIQGYLCILTTEVARKLVKLSESTPLYWIEDVYITGILREKANITITDIGKWGVQAKKLNCINEDEKFTAWANYSCDYHAGMDNRDTNLLVRYTEAMRKKKWHNETTLVDLENFKYLIRSSVCDSFDRNELLGVILVTSYVGHVAHREDYRKSISQSELNQMGLARVFLVAEIPLHEKSITQEDLDFEFLDNKDLVQGNFQDSDRNATYKNVMGLKWVTEKCSNAKFIIKMDDDTVCDVFFFRKFLHEKNMDLQFDRHHFLAGFFSSTHREKSKGAVTLEKFPVGTFPNSIQGGFYITTKQVARYFVNLSETTPIVWVADDVYITGTLREKADITITNIEKWCVPAHFLECSNDNDEMTAWSNYSCDYHVGFGNRDKHLLVLYTEAMRKKNLHDENKFFELL